MACRSRKCGTIQHEFHSRGSAGGRCRPNKKQKAIILIELNKLTTEGMACRSRKCGTIQHEFHSRGSAEGRCRTNKKQTVTALILLEKLCTEKEKRQHRFLAKNQVRTCGISERRFIQGDRPEAGAELAMTDRELAHLVRSSRRGGGEPERQTVAGS